MPAWTIAVKYNNYFFGIKVPVHWLKSKPFVQQWTSKTCQSMLYFCNDECTKSYWKTMQLVVKVLQDLSQLNKWNRMSIDTYYSHHCFTSLPIRYIHLKQLIVSNACKSHTLQGFQLPVELLTMALWPATGQIEGWGCSGPEVHHQNSTGTLQAWPE